MQNSINRLIVVSAVALAAVPDARPAGAADAAAGKAKAAMCAVCHGLDGVGRNPDVPHIAGDSAHYISAQLAAYRSGARQHPQMSIIAQSLTDEDIANLAAWYSSLKITVEMPE